MKSNSKSRTPIIAAHAKKNNGNKPAPPSEGKSNGAKRVSRASSKATEKIKCHVLERISDGIVAFDAEMNHIYVNERAGKILGRKPEELVGKNFLEIYPNLMGRPFVDACQRALGTQTIVPFDGYFAPSNTWFEARVYPSSDGLSILLREGKHPEESPRLASYNIYDVSQFPEQNPNPVMRFSRGGELLYANPSSADLLASWKGQTRHNLPIELQELLLVVSETGSNQEIELENDGKTYSCLMVPVQEQEYVNLYFSEITERRQTQESINALIHQTITGITRTDMQGRFLFVNQSFCEMTDYSESELLGKATWEVNHPEDVAKNKRMFERMMTEGEPYQLEKRIVRRNGSILWVTVGTSPLRDASGQIYAAVSVVVDITRRKRAEESLLDSARRTLYLASLSDAIRSIGSTRQIATEAVRILGLHLKASRVAYATVKPDGTATIRCSYSDGIADLNGTFNLDKYIPNQLWTKLRAGRTVVISDADQMARSSDPLKSSEEPASIHTHVVTPFLREGELVAALFVQQSQKRDWKNEEIHIIEETGERMETAIERARAEQELRESEKRFRILSDTVPSMVWSTAPDGTVQYLNEYWCGYTGLTTGQSIMNWKSTLHPEDYERVVSAWGHSLKTGADYSLELRYRRYDGEYRWFQSRAIPTRDENGNITAWYGVSTDIHDRVEKQEELQKIINSTPFMLTRCSRDLHYRFVSRAYAEMIGRTPEQVEGKPIIEIMGREGFHTILPYVEQVLQGKRVEYESEVSFENVGSPALHVVYTPDYDERGEVIGWIASITDITERKRSEEALRESEEKYRRIVETANEGIWEIDKDTRTVFVNRRLAEMFGYTPEEMISRSAFEFVLPEDHSEGEKRLQSAKQGKRSYASEFRYRRKDGSTLWTLASRSPKLDEQGNFLGSVAMLTDITQRKIIENQLKQSNQRLNEILTSIQDDFYVLDRDWKFVYVSRLFTSKVGKEPEDFIGNSIWEMFPKHVGTSFEENVRAAMEKREARRFEVGGKYTNAWYQMAAFPSADGITVLGTDITERKRAEDQLRELSQRLTYHVDNSPLAVIEWGPDMRLSRWSGTAERIFGWKAEEVLGKRIEDFPWIYKDDIPQVNDVSADLQTGNNVHRFSANRNYRKDGSVAYCEWYNSSLMDESGKLLSILSLVLDVTERKRAEEEIHHLNAQLQLQLDETKALLDILPTGVWIGNEDCSVITGNIAAYEMMGLPSGINASVTTSKPPMPASVRLFVNGEEVAPEDAPMQVVARSGKPLQNIEHELLFEDGTRKSVYVSIVPLFDANRNVRKVIGAYTDITERKQTEQTLARERTLLERLFETMPVMVSMYDPQTKSIRFNAEFERTVGWKAEEVSPALLLEALYPDPEYRANVLQRMAAASNTQEWVEVRVQTRDGRMLDSLWSNISIMDHEQLVTGIAIGIDITERKQGERTLVEYARQQSALYKLVDQLHRADTLTDIFDASLDAILSALQCDRASILLFDETQIMHFTAWRGLSEEYRKATDGHSPWKYGEENPMPIWYDDVSVSDLSDSLKTVIAREGIGSLAFIPLVYQDTLIGKFMVYYNTPHVFMESEIHLALTIARQLASAVDRKRAEERLRASEDRLRLAVTAGKIGIWDIDLVRRDRTWSKEGKEIYGLAEDEYLDFERQLELTHPDDRSYVDKMVRAFRDQGTISQLNLEHRILHPDGSVHWVEVQGEAVYDEKPLPIRLIGTIVDITERKRIEEALRQSEERFAQFMQYLPGLAWIKDVEGRYVFANAAAEKAFATPRDQLYGRTDTEVFPADVAAQFKKNDDLALTEASGIQVVEALAQEDGVVHYSLVTKFPIPDVDGESALIGGTAFDITEQRKTENALRESEERYRALVNQATAGIVRKDPSGRLIFVNDAFCEMLGYSASELAEKTMWQITYPADVSENRRLYNLLMTEGVPFQLEKRLIRGDGSVIWTTVSVSPVLDARGKPESAVSVYADITERKQAEGRLALLMEVSELTRKLEDPVELMASVADAVGKHFEVRRCLFNEIDIENDCEIVHRDYHDGVESVAGTHKLTDYSGITTREMIEGKTVVNFDSKIDPRTAADYERSYVPNGERAYVAIPLFREDRWVASLWISDDKPRHWSAEEVALLAMIAERTWTATEKLRINAALLESEQRLALTYEHAPIGIIETSEEGKYVRVNEEFCRLTGYTKEELLELGIHDLTSEEDHGLDTQLYRRLFAGEIPFYRLEKRYRRKDGGLLWAELVRSMIYDENGKPLYSIGAIFDITERKRAEEELRKLNLELEDRVLVRTAELRAAYESLRESEETSRLILESMPDAIIITDKGGHIVYGNTQVQSLFGYSAQEVIGKPVEILIPQRFHDQHVNNRFDYAQNPSRRYMGLDRDLFGQRKDESEFPVDVMLSPISNNSTWDVMVTIRDSTEQKQAQQALRANEEKLRKLFQVLPVGISFLDNQGQITEMNSALTQVLGLSKPDLLGGRFRQRRYIRSDGTLMPPSEFASVRAREEQKTVYNVETGVIKENGETIWTSVSAAPVDIAEVEVVVATIDITERKKAEEALHKHRERLRILSRRLVEVQEEERRAIARELHDRVGQNLAALNLNLNILRGQLTNTALLEVGQRLSDSVNLVNQILTITRNVMGDLRSDVLDDYGLEAALREFAEKFSVRTGVQVVFDKSAKPIPRMDPSIEMTMLRIAQEALTNVAKHAQGKQAAVSISADNEAVYMSIQDDGIGILSWQRANQPGSHGLRIIRERAEAFGGSLQVQSTYKKGTRIDVKIPLGNIGQSQLSREKRS